MSILERVHAFAPVPNSLERVRLSSLPVGHAWRVDGLDDAHVSALAAVLDATPPIVVNRRDMTVVDGAHRVAAARRRGVGTLEVEWFDGTELEAFQEFVARNAAAGRAASVADRNSGVMRTLRLAPGWSDRRIAHHCGVSPKLVARMRGDAAPPGTEKRIGRDGRARPVHPSAMRQQIVEAIGADPDASLRVIASRLGVSPETVRTVRREVQGGVERARTTPLVGTTIFASDFLAGSFRRTPPPAPWRDDQAFHSTEQGLSFVEWFDSTSVDGSETRLDEVPLSRVYEIADEARRRGAFWARFADDLERRTRNRR